MSILSNLKRKLVSASICGLLSIFVLSQAATAEVEQYRFSGPHTYENLSVYLIHGEDTFNASEVVTLDEALVQEKVIIHETGNVNELSIENISAGAFVFVQAGDIVKGGKQDRVLSRDLLLKPKSGKVPLASFCVEQGRWEQREGEAVDKFSSSKKRINSNALKFAAQSDQQQGKVWENVAKMQGKLGRNSGGEVRDSASRSSLQLSLESKAVQKSTKAYSETLLPILDKKRDAVGYVFAINGRLKSAEVYGANSLFKKLWPKLLDATVSEALAEKGAEQLATTFQPKELKQFLKNAESASEKERKLSSASESIRRENNEAAFFETQFADDSGAIIHKQYLKK